MTRWWSSDSPAASEPALPAAEPPALAPVERVAEIFERFFLWDARLASELIGELGRCSTADFVALFKTPPAARPDYRPPAETSAEVPTVPPDDQQPAAPVEPVDPHANWRWDSSGRRISPKLPSSFPRRNGYERPPGATFWSD